MSYKNIDVDELIASVQKSIEEDKEISSGLKSLIGVLIFLVTSLLQTKKTNSKNSSLPPSQDPYRKTDNNPPSENKRGGQKGRKGVTLEPVENPDEEIFLPLDKDLLPQGHKYTQGTPEKRQVFDLIIQRNVIEYSAEVWIDENGKRYTAEFPKEVKHSVQYGRNVKSHAVYLSQYQLMPTERISEYFTDKLHLPISEGSICNWNTKASELLETLKFPELLQKNLKESEILHLYETGFKIGSTNNWLHVASNDKWTKLFPHQKRGKEAMDEMGILENFKGVMIHDHWKPYYRYEDKTHSLCNAHHLRELQGVIDKEEKHQWAEKMKELLIQTKISTEGVGGSEENKGVLSEEEQAEVREKYRKILYEAGKKNGECPPPETEKRKKEKGEEKKGKKKRGRVKKTKSRNLLERFQNFEDDVLRFMTKKNIPFTNNLGERDLRMTKVKQKISGCFQSLQGAQNFALIRSYIGSAKKQNISPSNALNLLFDEKLFFL